MLQLAERTVGAKRPAVAMGPAYETLGECYGSTPVRRDSLDLGFGKLVCRDTVRGRSRWGYSHAGAERRKERLTC